MEKLLDSFYVEIWIRDKKTLKTAPITVGGENHHNAYVIFKKGFIEALEEVVKNDT